MRNGRFIMLIVCSLAMFPTFGQHNLNYLFRHITQADGLLHNQVLSIVQDAKGFIWVVTPNGLQRYDGSRFTYYREMLSNPGEDLPTGAEIYADNKNNLLWISKNTVVEKMVPAKNSFTIYDPERLYKDSFSHFAPYLTTGNCTWMLGNTGIYLYNNITREKLYEGSIIMRTPRKASYIFRDSLNNQTWVAAKAKVLLFDEKQKAVYSDDSNPLRHPLLESTLFGIGDRLPRFIIVDSRNNVWITTWGDLLYRYDPLTKKISTYFLSDIRSKQLNRKVSSSGLLINCMLEDDHDIMWIATENAGLLRYNRQKDNFDYCIDQEMNSESISYNYAILTLFQDREENIWIGTDKGITIFNPYRQYFRYIRQEENNPLSVSKSEIISFIQTDNSDIFIGTWGSGINVYDSRFQFKKNILFSGPAENNFIWCFLPVDTNRLWIGCQHGYLHIYDFVSGKTKNLRPPEMEGSTIRCMQKDSSGNIWFGLHNGKVIKWDKQTKTFLPFKDHLENALPVLNIFIDASQALWVSTQDGFMQFDPKNMAYSHTWLADTTNIHALSGKRCQGIEELNDSTLLIGTTYGGLNFFNKRTKTFSHLNTTNGLPSNNIYAIKKDTAGYIWFTTDYGLYKFKPAENKFIPYSIEPGIINSSFMANNFYPLRDGQWLTFTTSETISFFPARSASSDMSQPKTEITGFKLFDKPVFIDSLLSGNNPLRLSYKENFFTIEFAALNFSSLQQTNYYYRLHGIDKGWVNGGTKRFANYTDLQPGEYIFDVKAENANSSGEPASFKIIIAPPFWQTWWFISAIAVLIVLSVYWLIRKRINAIHHEAEMKQTIAQTQTMALRAQMNPHFIFNCLNSIDNLIQTDQKEKATDYLAKFARLIRAILENSKTNTIPCWKDLEALQLYLQMEELRWDKKIDCSMTVANEIQNGDYKVPPMIVQPFVENAIHHGLLNKIAPDKKLAIDVRLEGNKIKYTIVDNGVGRLKAGEYKKLNRATGTSFGMQITKDRINLFNQHANGSVKITDQYNELQQPTGTIVEVWLTTQPLTT